MKPEEAEQTYWRMQDLQERIAQVTKGKLLAPGLQGELGTLKCQQTIESDHRPILLEEYLKLEGYPIQDIVPPQLFDRPLEICVLCWNKELSRLRRPTPISSWWNVTMDFGIDDTRKEQREWRPFFKQVAVVGGRYLSIFDGATEYRIGERLDQEAHPDHNGGFYVRETPAQAWIKDFPHEAALYKPPRQFWITDPIKHFDPIPAVDRYAVLEIACCGYYVEYGHKLAFSSIVPVREVPQGAYPFNSLVKSGKEVHHGQG